MYERPFFFVRLFRQILNYSWQIQTAKINRDSNKNLTSIKLIASECAREIICLAIRTSLMSLLNQTAYLSEVPGEN